MKTDAIFYRLFETIPETLFLIEGLSVEAACAKAARYQYEALEFKETSLRIDGVFRPKETDLPLYFLEVQFYRLENVYADVLAKAFLYLKQHDPGQEFVAVVIFATRALEPKKLTPYRVFFENGLIKRYYLDELPEIADAPLGLAILGLIRATEKAAPETARNLVQRTKSEIADESLRHDLVQLIETIVIYKLPKLSREEIQAMLQVSDIRETKVYQEAKEEGFQEGIAIGIEKGIEKEKQRTFQEKLRLISQLAAMRIKPEDIAKMLELDFEFVRKELGSGQN